MTLTNSAISSNNDVVRVLLLEDYALDAELVRRHIKKTAPNWLVDHVSNKEHFIQYLDQHKPDVIVSDYALPSFNGLDAYLVIKNLGIEVPFIILTGQLPEASAHEFIESGIDDYVLKSSLLRLEYVIKRALERRKVQAECDRYAHQLDYSERRYKSIFDKAGVALAEFSFDNQLVEVQSAKNNLKAQRSLISAMVKSLRVTAVNKAALRLFEVPDEPSFKNELAALFGRSSLRFLVKNVMELASGGNVSEQLIEVKTFKGHARTLLVKTVLDTMRKTFVTASFTDMTAVRESELRTMRIVERLEDTVAARVKELSELNSKLKQEALERERINAALRENYIQMTESIIAAKRIQQILLPRLSEVTKNFTDGFIYNRPKGIVSGDIYWFHTDGDVQWIGCIDCTGHGVPGAFMSMLASRLLNQAVIEQGVTTPDEALRFIDTYVVREMRQHEAGTLVSTGMDISLCKIDLVNNDLFFSGAYQNILMKKEGQTELIRGDRYSLGGTFQHLSKTYTLHHRKLESGDFVYLFTDGILDQFGGPSNKKFTRKRFVNLITHLSTSNMYEQELTIKKRLQDWKGTNEQVDDILVMGIRV